MKNIQLFTFLIISAVITFSSCKDEEPEVKPKAVASTEPSFSCKVDGELWSVDQDDFYIIEEDTNYAIEFELDEDYLDITVLSIINGDTMYLEGAIELDGSSPVGSYNLSFDEEEEERYMLLVKQLEGMSFVDSYVATDESYTGYEYYDADLDEDVVVAAGSQTGTFTISTYDAATKKMSGTFNFNQVCSVDADPQLPTINVTEGMFANIAVDVE